MANMPTRSHLTSGTTTEANFQSAIGSFYDVVAQLALIGPEQSVDIDIDGNISPTKSLLVVDTYLDAPTDSLQLIVPTNIGEKVIFLRSESSARVVTLKNMQSGTGKMKLLGGVDAVLSSSDYVIALYWDSVNSYWRELWRNFGVYVSAGDQAAARTALGLGTASTRNTGTSSGQIPLIDNLGNVAFLSTGTGVTNVPTVTQANTLYSRLVNNLSDLPDKGAARGNLGLGAGATALIATQPQAQAGTDNTTLMTPLRVAQAIATLGGGLIGMQAFTASGTWTKPADCKSVVVFCTGGGGGGSSGVRNSSTFAPGAGGGAGGTAIDFIDVSAISTVAVTVGAGGAGGDGVGGGAGGPGGAGGASSFGAYCTGNGGSGGGATNTSLSVGGGGGGASGGIVNISGGWGTGVPRNINLIGGTGGASFWGGGGVNNTGGVAYGSGAGGSSASNDGSMADADAGRAGLVLVLMFG